MATRGDHAATLRALRNKLAREIDQCEQPGAIAQLAARLSDVLAQLEAIKAPTTTSKRDDLARKRKQRQSAVAGQPDAADSGSAVGAD